jgi:hypothetical protein
MTGEISRGLQSTEKDAADAQFELISLHLQRVLIEIITTSEYPLSEAKFETQAFPILT